MDLDAAIDIGNQIIRNLIQGKRNDKLIEEFFKNIGNKKDHNLIKDFQSALNDFEFDIAKKYLSEFINEIPGFSN